MNLPDGYAFNFVVPSFERDDIPFKGACDVAPVDVEVQTTDGHLPIVVVVKYRDEPDIVQEYRSTYEKSASWEQILVEAIGLAEVVCARGDIVWSAFGSPEDHYGAFSIMLRHLGFTVKS